MIYLIIALVIMAGVVYFLFKSNRNKKALITTLDDKNMELMDTIIQRNHIIKRMEEVNRETTKKKKKIHIGTDDDKFNNSLDILSDNDADSGAGKD